MELLRYVLPRDQYCQAGRTKVVIYVHLMPFCFGAAAEAEGKLREAPVYSHRGRSTRGRCGPAPIMFFILRSIPEIPKPGEEPSLFVLGLNEICPRQLCSDGGWKSVSEDYNHR